MCGFSNNTCSLCCKHKLCGAGWSFPSSVRRFAYILHMHMHYIYLCYITTTTISSSVSFFRFHFRFSFRRFQLLTGKRCKLEQRKRKTETGKRTTSLLTSMHARECSIIKPHPLRFVNLSLAPSKDSVSIASATAQAITDNVWFQRTLS